MVFVFFTHVKKILYNLLRFPMSRPTWFPLLLSYTVSSLRYHLTDPKYRLYSFHRESWADTWLSQKISELRGHVVSVAQLNRDSVINILLTPAAVHDPTTWRNPRNDYNEEARERGKDMSRRELTPSPKLWVKLQKGSVNRFKFIYHSPLTARSLRCVLLMRFTSGMWSVPR